MASAIAGPARRHRRPGEGLDGDGPQVLLLGRREHALRRAVPDVVGQGTDVEEIAEPVDGLEEQLGREMAAEAGVADLPLLLELVQGLDGVGHVPVAGLRRVSHRVAEQAEVHALGLPELEPGLGPLEDFAAIFLAALHFVRDADRDDHAVAGLESLDGLAGRGGFFERRAGIQEVHAHLQTHAYHLHGLVDGHFAQGAAGGGNAGNRPTVAAETDLRDLQTGLAQHTPANTAGGRRRFAAAGRPGFFKHCDGARNCASPRHFKKALRLGAEVARLRGFCSVMGVFLARVAINLFSDHDARTGRAAAGRRTCRSPPREPCERRRSGRRCSGRRYPDRRETAFRPCRHGRGSNRPTGDRRWKPHRPAWRREAPPCCGPWGRGGMAAPGI